MNLSGNTILITGGSSGIGFEIARQLRKQDNKVIITGRNQEKLKKAEAELGVTGIRSDVSRSEEIEELKQQISKEFPELNILINNAGTMQKVNLQNLSHSAETLTMELDVNVKGPIWMNDAFLPLLKGKSNAAIVIVSSGLAFVPLPISAVYCATKAALHSYSQSLRVQLANTNVKVFELAPPATRTELLGEFDDADMDGIAVMTVDKMVDVFLKGLAKDQYEICPGQASQLKFMGRFFPNFILKQLSKTVQVMQAG